MNKIETVIVDDCIERLERIGKGKLKLSVEQHYDMLKLMGHLRELKLRGTTPCKLQVP